MSRLRERQDYFEWRGDRYAFHQLVDGPSLARLDPYCEDEQRWPLHSRRIIFPNGAEVREIARQTQGLELPESRPEGSPVSVSDTLLKARVDALEERVAALEAAAGCDTPEPVVIEKIVEVEKIVHVEVPAAVAEPEKPADGIPDEFRGLMLPDELPEKFTERMKRRWQALQHLRIDGSKPTNSRALPDMTDEEIAELADLEARNKTANWLG